MISIVIAGYNCAGTIRATLESVLNQKHASVEIIFVDDGSTDETRRIVRMFPQVRLIEQSNQGPGVARNNGVAQAKGEYIAFLDSDDLWFPWTLKTYEHIIAEYDSPALVAGKLREFTEVTKLDETIENSLTYDSFSDYFASSRKGYFVGSGMMLVKKSAFESVGGFTTERIYAEDMDLAMRLGNCQGFVQILSPVTLGYRLHSANSRKNHALIYDGIVNLIESELRGEYPGSFARQKERRELITLFARPASLGFLDAGHRKMGWKVFRSTLSWHLRQWRWRYLMGFPLASLCRSMGSSAR